MAAGPPSEGAASQAFVCPRCGEPEAGSEFCLTCGLNLLEEDELPTRDDWLGARSRRETLTDSKAGADRPRRPTMAWAPKLVRPWVVLPVAALIVASAIGIAARGNNGAAPATTDRASEGSVTAPEERCVKLWNQPGASLAKSTATSYAERGEAIATVGFASDFPDRCQIVIASPDSGAGLVQVWRATGPGEDSASPIGAYRPVADGDVTELPTSAKQWNARIGPDGSIELGYP